MYFKQDNNLGLRDFAETDFVQIQKLWSDIGLGAMQRGDNEKIITETINNGGKFLVLEDTSSKQIIGTSWITNDKRRLYLHHFGIKKEHQGKGYSKLLLKETLRFAKSLGLQIKLEVNAENFKAVNLYQNFGFKHLGDYDIFIIRDYKNILFDE